MDTKQLTATLASLESSRTEALYTTIAIPAIIAIFTCSVAWLLSHTGKGNWLECTLLLGASAIYVCTQYLLHRAKANFKQQIIPGLLRQIEPTLRYQGHAHIDLDHFNAIKLFPRPDRYSGKDLIQGKVGDTQIKFSLVLAQAHQQPETSLNIEGIVTRSLSYLPIVNGLFFRPLFSGILFIADFNKSFTGQTYLRKPSFTILGKLFDDSEPVTLENLEFNQRFQVRSTDQAEARYILTPALMERLQQLHHKYDGLQAAFIDGQLYLAIDYPQAAFEPAIFESMRNPQQVQRISTALCNIIGIVEELDLNLRIWAKQA